MNQKVINIIIGGIAIIGVGILFNQIPAKDQSNREANLSAQTAQEQKADKVKVYYFHNTARCVSCRTLEKYTRETIEEFFQSELRDGEVEFRAINVDLPKNKDIARKYGATGSSLFINRIIDGKDNIKQNTGVWRLLRNESNFKNYLKNKIESYLK